MEYTRLGQSGLNAPMAQVALAWVLRQPVVSAPIRPTKVHHLSDAVAALAVELDGDEVRELEEHYIPHIPRSF